MPIESECLVVEFRGVSKHFKIQEPKTLKEFLSAFVAGKGAGQRFYALKDVSFGVRAGESLGIVGRNGSGKSTALKLIAGVMVPTDGQVIVRGHVCPLIELGAAFNPDLTGKENIYLGASILGLPNHTIRERISSIIDFAELRGFMDTPIKHYSSGMQVRLTFSVAVHCDPEILIIDESLAVGDAHFQEKCIGRMLEFQRQGVTILLVSHSLPLVEAFCTRAMILDAGRRIADGEPREIVSLYKDMLLASSGVPAT